MLNIIQILHQKLYPDNTYEKRRISNNANKTS